MTNQAPKPKESQNQGEGNRTADREYREGATRFAQTDKSKQKAREAADELEEAPKPKPNP
jgi:hypothetical protein